MLTLQDPNYQPPTAYNIWADPGFPLGFGPRLLWDLVETLRNTGWERQLAQYSGAKIPTWAGELGDDFTDVLNPGVLKFILPRNSATFPGFMTQWQAFHSDVGPLVFCWCPYDNRLSVESWLTGVTHELMECLTDWAPGNGWVNVGARDEGADDCETLASLSVSGFNGCVSSYWSNELGRCIQQSDL